MTWTLFLNHDVAHSAPRLVIQVRAGLEKAKQTLEKETADLSADLRSLASAKQDVEHKKKKVEGQLNDLHSRFNESERQRTELGERVSKMTVSRDGIIGQFVRFKLCSR